MAITHLRMASSSWFILSVWPLVWGWNPEERLAVAPRVWQKAFQSWEENCGPRSETMSAGMP